MPDNIQYSGPKYKSANEYGKEVNTSNLYSEPTNYGESVYDDQSISPMMTQSDVDEARAQNQGILDKLGSGLAHGLTTAGTSFIGGTVGLGNGLLDMMSGKSFYDNATFKLMDEISQSVNEATPLYQDKSEKNGDFVDSILTNDDFWIDGLFNGLGFVAGGYGSGAVFGKAVGTALKAAKLGQTAKVTEIAAKAGIEDVKGFADKITSFAQKVPNITAATTGRIYESTVEANQVYDSLKEKVASGEITEDQAKQARNAVFASNMALGIVDYFQYAKFLDNFSNHRASLNKIVKGVTGEYSQEVASKGFKAGVREFAKDSGDVIASMASEGAEEGAQHIISKTGETGDFTADNFMDSALQAMSDPQFYGAMLSGSLVGGVMGVPNEFGKASKQNKYTDDVVNMLNEHTDNKGNQILDAKAKLNSYYTIEKAKNDLQEKMSNPNISQEEIGVLHDQYRTLEHTQLTNFVQAAVESKTIDDKLEELDLLAKENADDLAEQAGVTEPKIKNGVPQNTATQLREKIQKIKDYRQTYENLQHTYPNVDVPTLGNMFKAQTEFDFAEKKLGIVNSKLSEANGKLARIQAEEQVGSLSSENAKEQSKLHLETIKNLQAEKEYYEDLQTQSVKKFNNPEVKSIVTKVKPVTKNTPEQNQRSKEILEEIKLAESQQNAGVVEPQEDTVSEEEKPTITQLEKSVDLLNEEKTSLQKSFLDLPRKDKKQARKRISEIDKKLGELSPWIETLKKAKEPLVNETASSINLRQPTQTYEERLASIKGGTETPLLSNHNKFKKVLSTLTDLELYDKLEESKSQEKDTQRALSQAKLDKLKGLQSLTQEDIDEIKEISYFADRRIREVENEILKRSLEKQGVVIVLNQNSDSSNENKYAIRQAEIEEAFKNNSVEDISENGKVFTIRGKKYFNLYSDPLFAINRDSNDNVVSVSLTDENNKSVTFSNDRIKDEIAFAILSQEVLKKEEKVIVSSEKIQEVIEQEISEDILLNDLIEVQETIALLKEDLNNEFLELVKLGFNKVEIKEHLKKEEKGKQLEELKEIESIIKKKLKGKSTLTTPVVKKSVKTKIKKNETKRTTRKTSTKTSEGVVEQVSTGEEHVVTEVPGQQVEEETASTASSSKVVQTPSDIETQKADIERRRQKKLKNEIWNNSETKFVGKSFLAKDGNTYIIEESELRSGDKVIKVKDKNGKTVSSAYFTKNEDGTYSIKKGTKVESEIQGIGLASAIYNYFDNNIGKIKRTDTTTDDGDALWSNNKNRINKKYDAELAALEKQEPSGVQNKKADLEEKIKKAEEEYELINYAQKGAPKRTLEEQIKIIKSLEEELKSISEKPEFTEEELQQIQDQLQQDALDEAYNEEGSKDTSVNMGDLVKDNWSIILDSDNPFDKKVEMISKILSKTSNNVKKSFAKLFTHTLDLLIKQGHKGPLTIDYLLELFPETEITPVLKIMLEDVVSTYNRISGFQEVITTEKLNEEAIQRSQSASDIQDFNEEINEKIFNKEQITTSFSSAYKAVETVGNSKNPKFSGGKVVFVDNKDYDKMHTNKVQIGEEWEIQLVNKPGEDLDSLELEFKFKNENGQYESRGFLHTIEYINSNNLPLSKEELEAEREKIREIRQHYLDGGENLKVTLNDVTHAKIEDNQKLFPIEGLDMFRNIYIKVDRNLQQGNINFEGNIVDDYSVEGNGSIYLMTPQATHTLGNPTVYIPQQLFKASLSQKKDAPINTALEEIRQGIIKEITEFFNNPKYSIPEKGFVKSWLYSVSGDKAVTLDSGIKLTRTESGPRLQTRDADVTNLEALDSIIDSLKPNIDKKRLDKSDYQQQLFNAKLLTTKIATKVIEGGERLYAFQPTFKFSLNSVIPSVKTKEVIEKVSPDTQSSIEELGSMGINLFEDEGDYSIDVSPEEGLQVNPELSLEEDNAIIDAIGYKIVTEKLNKEGVKDFFTKAISLIETTLKGEGLTERQINSATEKLKGFKSIVKDFDKYFDKTKELLSARDFKFNKEGIVEAVVELEEEGNQQMTDGYASKEDRLASAPSEIRRLISYTPMYDANNKPVLNHLGMNMFAPVDFVFSQLIEILCGEDYQNTEESFKKMTFLMSEASSKQVQHIGEIISTTKDTQLKNQFYNVFSAEKESPITSVFFQKKFEVKGSQDAFGRPLKETKTSMRDNRADSSTGMAIIKNEWKQSLEKNSQLVSEEGINKEFVKEVISDIDSVISNDTLFKGDRSKYLTEEGLTLVSRALNKLGIDVTATGVNQFLKNIGTNSTSNRNDKTTLSQNLKGYFLNKFLQVDNLKDIFDNESSTLEKLATATLITSNRSIGGTYRVAGTQYSSIVRSSPMNEKINWVKRNWEDLKNTTPFRFLSNNLRGLSYVVDRGFRFNKKNSDPKFIKDTNPIEFETQNAIRFMANRSLKTETMSDKSWNGYFLNSSPEIASPLAFNSSTQTYGQNKEVLDNLYKYFELELLKINTYQERLKNTQNILVGVDSTENVKGAGEYFYYYEFLNAEILEEGTEEDKVLLQEMYEKQNGVYRLRKIENLSPESTKVIRKKIQQRFNKIYANNERTWKKYGIIQGKKAKNSEQVTWSIPQMPDNYKENFLNNYTEDLKIKHTLMDYTYSYMTSFIETNFMFGDPAQQSKMKVSEKALTAKQVLNGVILTFDNVGKRNARLKAQGNRGVWKTPIYKVLIVSDMGIDPSFIEQYPEDVKEAYLDKKGEKMTDAQELTTVWEHLSDRLAHGDQEVSVRELMLGMMLYDRGHYDMMYKNPNSELYKYPNVQPSRDLTEIEKREINSKGLLQPRKPVQVVSRINNGLVEEFYIKTSSIPLLPSVIKGLPMEKVYRAMLKHGVQRIPFVSGVKIGAIGVQPLFNEDGGFNEESFNHAVTLNRSGFHNQLAVPYDENKGMIREASQLMKLLFVDLPDETVLESGKTVKQLKEAYIKAQNNLIKKGQTKLLGKLFDEGAVSVDDNGNYIVNNVEKLAKLLLEEGDDFSDNTKKMLQTNGKGDFLFPLTFNPSIGSIQPILQALITNAMMRIKINGKSYVQASEVVTYDKRKVKSGEELTTQESNDILYTKPEYKGLKKLKYIKKGENGAKSDRAQVYVPFYFTYEGKRIPVSKFIIENEDGSKTLDLERIPEELLVLNGFRIPTEGRKSMMMFDVVGFLPESMGDTVIVPSEIAAQMGSDYDVDKLYMYHYEVDYYNDMSEEDYDTEEQVRKIQSENYNSISDPEVKKILESLKNEIEELKDLKKNAQTKEAKRAIQDQLDSIYEDKKAIHTQIGELKDALEQGSQMISGFKEKRKMRLDKTIGSDVNDLIDIHDQILMSSHAFDSVVTPQGFDALEASINEYYSKYGDTSEWTGMYDPNYQRNLFFDNKAGKQGTAIAANANTFHAIAQDAKLYINDTGILFKDEKGEYYNESNNVVKGKRNSVSEFNESSYDQDINSNSAWRLDKIFTYDGQPISQLISEWLGASVDNAKAKLLAKGGINDHNLALSLTLIQAGFNHDWVISFINQPILKDLYEEVDKNSSMFDTRFSPDKLNASREELLEKYSSTSKTSMLEGYMLSEYKDMLGKSIEQLSEEDKTKQRNILETFLHYDKITQSIRSVQSNWIIDSKGLPKNYTETLELVRKQSKVAQDSSEGKGIGNVPNLRRSIIGEFAKVPRFSQVLYSKVLDFDKAAYNEIVSNISRNLGKFGEMFADDLNPIYNGIFSYIYTHPDVQSKIADGKSVNQYKKELWEGLPNKLSELKKKYPQNNLLNRISVGDNGALVMGNSFIKTESLEKAITLSWLDAMKATQPDQELKQFGLDLAAYTMYFNNSLFGVSNFMKYLPFEYFKAIDLGTLSHKLTDKLNEPDFLVEFEKQYFQHNPGLAKSITTSIVKEKDKLPEGVFTEFTKKGDYEDVHKIILDVSSVAASKLVAGLSDSNQITDYIKFVKNYNRDTQEFDLFELVPTEDNFLHYQRIDTLGEDKTSILEYQFGETDKKTIFKENTDAFDESLIKVEEGLNTKPASISKQPKSTDPLFKFKVDGELTNSTDELLNNVIGSSNKANSALAKFLKEHVKGHKVEYGSLTMGPGFHRGNVVKFDLTQLENKQHLIESTILHELFHAATEDKLNDPEFQKTYEYHRLVGAYNVYVDSFQGVEKRYLAVFQEELEKAKRDGKKLNTKNLPQDVIDNYDAYYSATSLSEFVAGAPTSENTQKRLGEDESSVKKIVNEIIQIIKDALGITKGSSLDEALDSIMGVVKYDKQLAIAKKKLQEQYSMDLGMSVGDFLKEMTIEQKRKFWELRRNGIFASKC